LVGLLTRAGQPGVTTTTINDWAQRHTPDVDVDRETAAFLERNAGQDLHDIRAAWQAWMRKARPASSRSQVPARADGTIPADAPRCHIDGHEHELATNCRLCAAERIAHPTDPMTEPTEGPTP
jgi:hypothetical protein